MFNRRSPSTLIGLAVAFSLGTFATGDEDGAKRRDRRPAYDGPGYVGGQWTDGGDGPGGGVAGAFDAKNITLLSWLPLNMFEGNSASAADLWGYVSPSGREYAIVGLERGTAFVEVTDPVNPVIVEVITGPNSLWKDIAVVGAYAYSGSEGGSGIQIMDMTQIDSGIVTLVKNDMNNGHSSTHTIVQDDESGFMYLCGSNLGGLVAVTTADPRELSIVGQWNDGTYVHEALPITWQGGAYDGRQLVICFSGGDGVDVIDVTNKGSMTRIGGTTYPQLAYCHQGWVSPDFQYLYVNDELDNINTTRVFDVSDPSNPTYIKSFPQMTGSIDHNLYYKDGKIYESNYTSGLRIFDAADPENPVEVAYIDTHPESNAASFNGSWGNYPYLPSGTILISDLERGLIIVKEEVGSLDFDFASDLPTQLTPGIATPIVTTITEDEIELDPATVRLHVSINGGGFDALEMTPDGQGGFTASIPASECFDEAAFYLSAGATDGRTFTSPVGAPTQNYQAKVFTGIVTVTSDPMEDETGWVSGAQGDTAVTGKWNRTNPEETAAQPGDDHTANGTECWVTDGRGGGLGDYDVDGGKTTLRSTIYDLSAYADASIRYWRWYSNSTGGAPFSDVFRVDISNNGGGNWTSVEVVGPDGPEVSGGWFFHEFLVSDFVAPSAQVQVRFIAEDAGEGSLVEAAVDDFEIVVVECEENSCAPDLNGDGTLDLFDFLAFTNLFNAKDPGADWDGNGSFELFDFLGFVNAFNAGC
jgi:choice-of-anchor B domain-containing protein